MTRLRTACAAAALIAACGLAGTSGAQSASPTMGQAPAHISQSPVHPDAPAKPSMEPAMTLAPMDGISTSDYLMQAGASDGYEIQAAKIAISKTKTPAIDRFAHMMVKDHSTSSAMVKAAADKDGVMVSPPMLTTQQQSDLDMLSATPPESFDMVYVKNQKMAHDMAWQVQKGYADTGDMPNLKAAAGRIVPVVETHRDMLNKMSMTMPGM